MVSSANQRPFTFVVRTNSIVASKQEHEVRISAVRAHVARLGHRERKKKKKAAQEKLATDQMNKPIKLLPSSETLDSHASPRDTHPLLVHPSKTTDTSTSRRLTQVNPLSLSQTAALPLYKGNSDPFASLPFDVTPQTATLISFFRDVTQPSLFFTPFFRRVSTVPVPPSWRLSMTETNSYITSSSAQKHWNLFVSTLRDRCSALGCLAVAATAMAASLDDSEARAKAQTVALRLRVQSSELLRRKVAKTVADGKHDQSLVTAIVWLAVAETRSGNYCAAAVHARWVCPILRERFEAGSVPISMLLLIILHDIDVAFQTHSTVQIGMGWVEKTLKDSWTESELLIIDRGRLGDCDVHRSVSGDLRTWLQSLKTIYRYWVHPCGEEVEIATRVKIFSTCMLRWLSIVGSLCDIYTDLMSSALNSTTREEKVEASVALTVLRYITALPGWGDGSLNNAISIRIQQLLIELLEILGDDADLVYPILYVLYTGTVSEVEANARRRSSWFVSRLRDFARRHKITTWHHCKEILKQFFFVKTKLTDGTKWFESLVRGTTLGISCFHQNKGPPIAGLWQTGRVLQWTIGGKEEVHGIVTQLNEESSRGVKIELSSTPRPTQVTKA